MSVHLNAQYQRHAALSVQIILPILVMLNKSWQFMISASLIAVGRRSVKTKREFVLKYEFKLIFLGVHENSQLHSALQSI